MKAQPIRAAVRIIGIDPGLRRTGWGVIESEGNRLIYVGCGSVDPTTCRWRTGCWRSTKGSPRS